MQIIDNEPKWIKFLQGLKTESDVAIVGSRMMERIPELTAQGIRVIVATGTPTTREAIAAYRLGASDYIIKDFTPQVILASIAALDTVNVR